MANKVTYVVFVRVLIIIFGCSALFWGLSVSVLFQKQSLIERVSARIINGDRYKPETLTGLAPALEMIKSAERCHPKALRSAAIIQLRILEGKLVSPEELPYLAQLKAEQEQIKRSLSCAPADPFLWLVLFGLDSNRQNLSEKELGLLRLSYQLGPNEGWVSLKRNPIALDLFEVLPGDLKEAALNEFSNIVKMSYADAGDILTGPGWPVRETLLAHLIKIDRPYREAFEQYLFGRGYEVSVPGIERAKAKR